MAKGIEHARRRRAQKAQALRSLQIGRTTLWQTLLRPPTRLLHVELHTVLLACPDMGKQGVRRLCERTSIWPLTPLGELTESERRLLMECLPDKFKEET